MFRFSHNEYFWLLTVIPALTLLLILFLLWRKKALNRYGDPVIFLPLMPEASSIKTILKFVLQMVAVTGLIVALAQPQTGSRMEKIQRKGIDIMICLDVSNSMLAGDIKPNRLERAKQSISRLIDRLEGDRIGLIVFAGKAYTQLPITTDYAAAKLFLNTVNTGIAPTQGTAIADAIELAANSFGESKHNKAIIVITDGEDHEGNTLEQTEAAVKKGMTVYTIGMGLPEGAPIPVFRDKVMTGYKKDREGNTIISKLDETLLQRIASIGGGIYIRANNVESGLNRIFDEINKIQKTEIETKQFADYEDQYQYFAGFALLILFLDLFIFERKTFWMKGLKPFLRE
jgi:Ca-activated chloride channel family protein